MTKSYLNIVGCNKGKQTFCLVFIVSNVKIRASFLGFVNSCFRCSCSKSPFGENECPKEFHERGIGARGLGIRASEMAIQNSLIESWLRGMAFRSFRVKKRRGELGKSEEEVRNCESEKHVGRLVDRENCRQRLCCNGLFRKIDKIFGRYIDFVVSLHTENQQKKGVKNRNLEIKKRNK